MMSNNQPGPSQGQNQSQAPPHPILKKESTEAQTKKIKWDEVAIQEYEQERGMHQKIIEPPTPFNFDYHPEDEEEEVPKSKPANVLFDPAAAAAMLEGETIAPIGQEDDTDSQDAACDGSDGMMTEEQAAEFASKRDSHYKNMGAILRLKQQYNVDLDDDDSVPASPNPAPSGKV